MPAIALGNFHTRPLEQSFYVSCVAGSTCLKTERLLIIFFYSGPLFLRVDVCGVAMFNIIQKLQVSHSRCPLLYVATCH